MHKARRRRWVRPYDVSIEQEIENDIEHNIIKAGRDVQADEEKKQQHTPNRKESPKPSSKPKPKWIPPSQEVLSFEEYLQVFFSCYCVVCALCVRVCPHF